MFTISTTEKMCQYISAKIIIKLKYIKEFSDILESTLSEICRSRKNTWKQQLV